MPVPVLGLLPEFVRSRKASGGIHPVSQPRLLTNSAHPVDRRI
jgi:hypothetical protein